MLGRMRPRVPLGSSASGRAARRAARSSAYGAERERTAEFHAIAKLVIHRRTILGITQRELARRVGTQETAISRLESGRHATNVRTVRRIFEALGGHLVIGYEAPRDRGSAARRELVAV
jgi:ribosome-binding protein aMBF1 (putative translation factor)